MLPMDLTSCKLEPRRKGRKRRRFCHQVAFALWPLRFFPNSRQFGKTGARACLLQGGLELPTFYSGVPRFNQVTKPFSEFWRARGFLVLRKAYLKPGFPKFPEIWENRSGPGFPKPPGIWEIVVPNSREFLKPEPLLFSQIPGCENVRPASK